VPLRLLLQAVSRLMAGPARQQAGEGRAHTRRWNMALIWLAAAWLAAAASGRHTQAAAAAAGSLAAG
jgi:hypothetical protein